MPNHFDAYFDGDADDDDDGRDEEREASAGEERKFVLEMPN